VLVCLVIGIGLVVLGFLALRVWGPENFVVPSPRFTLGQETTYVTEPLDKDGYIDYETALNNRLGKDVTPESNANVLIWKALGPHPRGSKMRVEYFRLLGIEAPPEDGAYFDGCDDWYKKGQLQLKPGRGLPSWPPREAPDLNRVTRRPWMAKEQPIVAEWLEANERPLALLIEATQRPDYYNPLVEHRDKKGPCGLMGARLPNVQQCREAARALVARALLRVNEGNVDPAWQDLLACHRLGRLVARGGTLIEYLIGVSIHYTASNANLAFLDRAPLTARKAQACLRDLQRLPPLPAVADKFDLTERFTFLQTVVLLNRYGPENVEDIRYGRPPEHSNSRSQRALAWIDWDPALETGNRWFDRAVATLRCKDREIREMELEQLEEELQALKKNLPEGTFAKLVLGMSGPDRAVSERIGDTLISRLFPTIRKMQDCADRSEQVQRNLCIASALAAYRGDHGRYPPALDLLDPMYLEQVPTDLFSGMRLLYRPSEDSYLLSSVGSNGRDEGEGKQEDPLSICMPLPELKRQ
jgi:hypothetical protein